MDATMAGTVGGIRAVSVPPVDGSESISHASGLQHCGDVGFPAVHWHSLGYHTYHRPMFYISQVLEILFW